MPKKYPWIIQLTTVRLPKEIRYKLEIISEKNFTTLTDCMIQILINGVRDWELKYGEIELPKDIAFMKDEGKQ